MNELTISTTNAPTSFSFKNAKLNELSAKIAEQSAVMNKVYSTARDGAEVVNKSLAPLFGELLTTKCYIDDGFKSVQDYAEQTFSMSKSMAYMLARVGVQFYLTDNEYTRKARETLSTSKLAELCKVDRVAIAAAIDGGELAEDTPLADCRAFAETHRAPSKERVLSTFDLYVVSPVYDGGKRLILENVVKNELQPQAAEYSGLDLYTSVKLDGDKPSAAQHFVMYAVDGTCAMFEYRPHVKSRSSKGKFNLVEYLKGLNTEQLAEFKRMLDEQAEQDVQGE